MHGAMLLPAMSLIGQDVSKSVLPLYHMFEVVLGYLVMKRSCFQHDIRRKADGPRGGYLADCRDYNEE
jgi:hypothetical protein